ncbi:hypothetical protein ACJU26_01470 [Acidithiobacillus sp. M4-SHS-6]|uniref:hypothetical protein n=1 Tax=Acidithiobacillus sp. M4-SHS-6 TaxID=3383024 RepID=UPI0039BE5988
MPMVNIMSIIGVIIAVGILLFLVLALVYLISPQKLDGFLHGVGVHRGIGIFTAKNVFLVLSRLAGVMILLGVLTIAMVLLQSWPRGWLIPAAQELIMAIILFAVSYWGRKSKANDGKPGAHR